MDNNFNNQGEYHNYSQQPPQGGYPQPQDYPTPPYYDPNSQGDPNQPNSGLAIASMVLGICGVVFLLRRGDRVLLTPPVTFLKLEIRD